MENASKALLMAGSILIGVLILSLMTTLFLSARTVSEQYEEVKKSETIQQFNVNFTKKLGKDLTIHEVITIYNFAEQNGFNSSDIVKAGGSFEFDADQISQDLEDANVKLLGSTEYYKVEKIYRLSIEEYNEKTGYISKIKITQPVQKFKCYKKDVSTGKIDIKYES